MADEIVYANSMSDDSTQNPFIEKQFLYVNDNNSSSYTGQIILDSTALSNSGSWIGWSEAYMAIPLVLQIESANLTAVKKADFCCAMKAGYWQLIHSMSVEFNNGSVVQQTPFLNVYSSYKNLTSWSDDDLQNWGKLTGFNVDTADSWLFNSAANAIANELSANGTGLSNNRTSKTFAPSGVVSDAAYPPAAFTATPTVLCTESTGLSDSVAGCANAGYLQRLKWLNFDVAGPAGKSQLLAGTADGLKSIFKSYVQSSAGVRAVVFQAVIRLKDVCDFFAKMPLLKGSTMRLFVNTNQTYLTLNQASTAVSAAGAVTARGSLSLKASPVILGGGQTCALMVSSADLGQGLQGICPPTEAQATATDIQVGLSIVKTQFSQLTQISCPVSSVRLYAPAYTMTPQAEARYLAMSPTKKIVYEDIFQYSFNGVEASSDFNILVSNGLPNLKSLVTMGFLPASANGTAGAGAYVGVTSSSLLSPFASSGGTPDPIAITNYQVQISGKNLFNNNIQYDYDEFLSQVVSSNQLNGSATTGIGSGLIGEYEFSNLYRYYVANCARGQPSDDGISKSIQIMGKNLSASKINLMVFAVFEKSITLDIRSGARVA